MFGGRLIPTFEKRKRAHIYYSLWDKLNIVHQIILAMTRYQQHI